MARYTYTASDKGGKCVGYLESTTDEEKLDVIGDEIAVGFTGNGYLRFWRRCKELELTLDCELAASEIIDTYTGESKRW